MAFARRYEGFHEADFAHARKRSCMGLGFSMHSLIMGHLGSDATAAASITSVVQEIVTCVCKGVSAGAGIIIGKLLGQNLFDKAKAYGR